ncbi:MAG TPA: integrase core domain-containing protein [Polyangiaceae bacterium]|nr:integrase core domain-containing protein [Polyangiaceae bacterium]
MGWLRLGSRLERTEPGKPQQNGRQERFRRTLKAGDHEASTGLLGNWAAQQRAFECLRREYNEERPHEALGQPPPSTDLRSRQRATVSPRPFQR